MKFLGFIDNLYDKKISSKGLAVFRICFALNLFFEVNRIFRYRQLYFDTIPFLEPSNINFAIPLIIWMIVLLFIVFGAFTRIMTVINYGFVFFIINGLGVYEYHMDYTYLGVSFLLPFVSLSKSISIDSLREKLRYSNTKYLHQICEKTSVLSHFIIIFVGIALVYFGSVFFKFQSIAWMNGLGIWLPSSIPQVTILNDQWLLNQEYLVKISGYSVLIFEIIFPFVFFIKKLRTFLVCIGVVLHVGILLEFPIPFFALGYIAIYLLMIPVSFWNLIQQKLQSKTPRLFFFYDKNCLRSVKKKIIFSHFDIFELISFEEFQELHVSNKIYSIDQKGEKAIGFETYKKLSGLIPLFYPLRLLFFIPGINYIADKIYNFLKNKRVKEKFFKSIWQFPKLTIFNSSYGRKKFKIKACKTFFLALLILQFNVSFNFPLNKRIINKVESVYPTLHKPINKLLSIKEKLNYKAKIFLGITGHGVFVDSHYKGFDKIFNLTYKGQLLPMYDENGMVDFYLKGGIWANYNFRVNKPYVLNNPELLKRGLVRYSSFWAHKNNIDLNDSEFKIIKKNINLTFKWEKDFLKNNLANPWEEVGIMTWINNKAIVKLNKLDVEN